MGKTGSVDDASGSVTGGGSRMTDKDEDGGTTNIRPAAVTTAEGGGTCSEQKDIGSGNAGEAPATAPVTSSFSSKQEKILVVMEVDMGLYDLTTKQGKLMALCYVFSTSAC